jgi:hypothetical protein
LRFSPLGATYGWTKPLLFGSGIPKSSTVLAQVVGAIYLLEPLPSGAFPTFLFKVEVTSSKSIGSGACWYPENEELEETWRRFAGRSGVVGIV